MDIIPGLPPVATSAFKNHANPLEPASERGSLPCLYSNNCTGSRRGLPVEWLPVLEEHVAESKALHVVDGLIFSQQQRKSASALAWNVKAFVDRFGLEHVGFLTLTFADDVRDPREAQQRFRSLRTHVLSVRYRAHIRVLERQKSERIHYHLLVALPSDIRSGADFGAFQGGDYRSASLALRNEWAFWRTTAPLYRFGRTELLPIRSTAEGIGRYVGKYIGKHLCQRQSGDKGVRLVEYSSGARMATTKFSWTTPGAASWRRKVRLFASIMSHDPSDPIPFRSFSAVFGSRWAYHYRDFIWSLPD